MLSIQRDLPIQMCNSFNAISLFVHLLRFLIKLNSKMLDLLNFI